MKIQSHRGFKAKYPENTLLAFEKAIEAGTDLIETDLGITADGEVVLIHDQTLERTTNGVGEVTKSSLAQLRSLDAGSWMGPEFAGERIPTLEEAIELIAGRAILNLEIKSRKRPFEHVERIVARAAEVVRRLGAEESVCYSSFDPNALLEVRKYDPNARLLLIDWTESLDGIHTAKEARFWGWLTRWNYATDERVTRAKEAGLKVIMGLGPDFPVDIIERSLVWEVYGFSGDDTERIVQYVRERTR